MSLFSLSAINEKFVCRNEGHQSMPHNYGIGNKKVGKVMHEFKSGKLHSGKSGKIVKSRKQAVAIAMSEAGLSKKG